MEVKLNDSIPSVTTNPLCSQCKSSVSKYCCPRCNIRTCSLPCVKAHKENLGCTGKRERTTFVKLSEFHDGHLISDYSFLEEALQEYEASKKLQHEIGSNRRQLPASMISLKHQARNRGINISFLSQGMTKRKQNSSFYDKRRKCIFWRLAWFFPSVNVSLVDPKVDENESLIKALEKKLNIDTKSVTFKQSLKPYVDIGPQELLFFLRKEPSPANRIEYIQLNVGDTLVSQLQGLSVVEFPVIYVALPSEAVDYRIVSRPEIQSKNKVCGQVDKADESGIHCQNGRFFAEEEIENSDL